MKVADFKKLLPALHQIARYPTCNRAFVCRKRFVELSQVEAAIAELSRAHGVAGAWDEATLALAAKKLGVGVPERFALPEPPALAEVPARPAVPPQLRTRIVSVELPAAAPVIRETQTETPIVESVLQAISRAGSGRKNVLKYLTVCRLLLADRNLSEAATCRRAGVSQPSWAAWKRKNLGLGCIDPAKIETAIKALDARLKTSPAPAAPEAPTLPAILPKEVRQYEVLEDLVAKKQAEVLAGGAITAKERRHLKVSILTGLLANRTAKLRGNPKTLVREANEHYEELIAQDEAAVSAAGNGGAT